MTQLTRLDRLAGIVAERMAGMSAGDVEPSPVGTALQGLLDVLELFVPALLRQNFPKWGDESLDGFLLTTASREADGTFHLAGLATLISDQAVTPFEITLHPTASASLRRADVALGEPGGGHLGISGPLCTSGAATRMVKGLVVRLPLVAWVYRSTYSGR